MTETTRTPLETGFREAMAHLCAPVAVVTAMDGARPHGTTVSAVMSLSLEPLLVAVALADTSDCLGLINANRTFGVNVLAADQHAVASRLAKKGREKFADLPWEVAGGVPRLSGAAVWLRCTLADTAPGGDHRILIGEVRDVATVTEAAPLTYHRRQFGTHLPHLD
ncbi:flavin reductase family protein [Nocardia callitridis]|uniref:Flavin reductase family protein n=1 Tax=Nocardia callitridis TaxID=648753 RepID=A0ABP9KKI9_9NOCA